MRPDELERRLRERLDALGPAPRAELLHVLMLPDLERAERIGEFWSYPQNRAFAETPTVYATQSRSFSVPSGMIVLQNTALQMVRVLDAEPGLEGGVVDRWAERPVTRFERKGTAAGRGIADLRYRRTA